MIETTLKWGSILHDILGRMLLQDQDEQNAQKAFQLSIEAQDGITTFTHVQCDGCGLFISCEMQCFVCRGLLRC